MGKGIDLTIKRIFHTVDYHDYAVFNGSEQLCFFALLSPVAGTLSFYSDSSFQHKFFEANVGPSGEGISVWDKIIGVKELQDVSPMLSTIIIFKFLIMLKKNEFPDQVTHFC